MKMNLSAPSSEGATPFGALRARVMVVLSLVMFAIGGPAVAQIIVQPGATRDFSFDMYGQVYSWNGVTQYPRGSLSASPSGKHVTMTYTAPSQQGPDSFTFSWRYCQDSCPSMSEGGGTVSIYVGTPPIPTAQPTSAVTTVGQQVTVTPTVTDTTSLQIVESPLNGSATVAGLSIKYTPQPGFVGSDSLRFRANGTYGSSGYTQISFTVVGTPTVSGASATTVANQTVRIPISTTYATSVEVPSDGLAAHGAVSIDGFAAVYTPSADYMGPDSFAVRALGPGGMSLSERVNVTVQPPPAATVSAGNLALAFNTPGTHNFSPTNGGVVAISRQPAHGTVTLDGAGRATYTPNPDFIGSDDFVGQATNLAGPGPAQTVTVTVAPPPVPSITGGSLNLAFNTSGSHDFAPTNGGVLAIEVQPQHGTLSVVGSVAAYTPNADFIGADSFEASATNLGGKSAARTVSVTVAPPPIPTLTGGNLTLAFNTPGSHNFAPTHGGVLAIAAAPVHGTVTIFGGAATYTPDSDYIGADSFAVTGTNLGGTSAALTVSVMVAPPPIPSITGGSLALAFNSEGSHDFAPTERGVLALASPPSNGIVTIVGGRTTYRPNRDYIGPDAFSVTATNLGGTSAPVALQISVSPPAAPGAGSASLSTAYGASGSVLLPASGIFSSLEVVDVPTHGTVMIAATEATYTPDNGYFGPDSFSYRAIGFGGASGPATVAVTVGRPDAPQIAGATATTPHATSVLLPLTVTGVFDSVRLVGAPSNGVVVIEGGSAKYTPTVGFAGEDRFSIVAVGPGGDSAAAEFVIMVPALPVVEPTPPPPPPLTPPAATVEGQAGSPMRFRVTQGMAGGPFKGVEVVSPPDVGATSVEALDVLYTPPADFAGQVKFSVRVLTEAGPSEAAVMTAIVHAPAPEAPVKEAIASPDQPGVVELTEGVANGPFSDAAIVSMSPASAGKAELVKGGAASRAAPAAMMRGKVAGGSSAMAADPATTFQLKFKPTDGYFGEVVIRYSLTNRFGAPAQGVVRFMVDAREEPTRDPKVAATINAQAQAATRYGEAQIANVGRRMEKLRLGAGSAVAVNLSSSRPAIDSEPFTDPIRARELADLQVAAGPRSSETRASGAGKAKGPGIWVGGAVQLGERRGEGGGFDFSSSGVSIGADFEPLEGLFVGAGLGAGRDRSDLGDQAEVKSTAASVFAYSSYTLTNGVFIDGTAGAGRLDFDSRRETKVGQVGGSRSGQQWFASLSTGFDLQRERWWMTPYGRIAFVSSRLGSYREDGPDAVVLVFDALNIEQSSGALGLRGGHRWKVNGGLLEVGARGELVWSLRSSGSNMVGYAVGSDKRYSLPVALFDEQRSLVGLSASWAPTGNWRFTADLERTLSTLGDATTVRIGGAGSF